MNELKTAIQKARTLWKINAIMEIAVDGITALSPAQIEELKALAKSIGFDKFQIGPLVRSSYNAANLAK